MLDSTADPGFPIGGGGGGGGGGPTQTIFGTNVCETQRIGSLVGEGGLRRRPPRIRQRDYVFFSKSLPEPLICILCPIL